MNGWILVAGIFAVAGLDGIAIAGGSLEVPALLAAFALLVAGVRLLDDGRPKAGATVAPLTEGDPREGLTPMRWPVDYAAAGVIGASTFALSFIGYWRPAGNSCWTLNGASHCGIFDELYFARAGEEYLQNLRIYENTHPPLSKLLVTLSMMLFGGIPAGDNPWGWRFLDVVFGALVVVVLYAFAKRVTGSTPFASIAAVLLSLDGMHFVQSRIATPEGFVVLFATFATYALYRFAIQLRAGGPHYGWLMAFSIALGCLVSTKWYGVMLFGVSFILLVWIAFRRKPCGFRFDRAALTIVCVPAAVYLSSWIPDLLRNSPDPGEIHSFSDIVARQASMFYYHDTLRATHPYSSQWWEWPLDYVPVAYFYEDTRKNQEDPNGCCIYEITSMPNPIVVWLGLISVPLVGWLAISRRSIGYLLIVLTYLMQWLPWAQSPRITFAYHFYVDVPLICLCNAILLQRMKTASRFASATYVALAASAFVFFYPILSAHGLPWNAWHARMWFPTWVRGPG